MYGYSAYDIDGDYFRKEGYKSRYTAFKALNLLRMQTKIKSFRVFKIDALGYHTIMSWEDVNE